MSLGKVLRATFSNWCQQTSIAGINNIAQSKSYIKKFYWFILFCVGCYITVNSLVSTVLDYRAFDVTTSNDLEYKTSVPFPAISICNLNRLIP